jgi:hypothetical protein
MHAAPVSHQPAAAPPPVLAGWANNELQCYTNSQSNVRVEAPPSTNGVLVIEAQANSNRKSLCVNLRSRNTTRAYTSAKLTTAGKWTAQRSAGWEQACV